MGADLGAHAISHLEEVSPEGIQAMVDSGIIGVVLPTTAYVLRLKPPPVRQMIDSGMAVALGSDLNPNAHCLAMVSKLTIINTLSNKVGLMLGQRRRRWPNIELACIIY